MGYFGKFAQWKSEPFFDTETRTELLNLDPNNEYDHEEIKDRFYREVEFGTGGMRGVMGAGTNRINKYVIGKATTGLADYLLDQYNNTLCSTCGVSICYDTRINSKKFAEATAKVLSSKGIKVYLFEDARPTPQLSFAVKHLNCIAGIVITASHNPKEYNGYKLYDENGCQMVPEQIHRIVPYIDRVAAYQDVDFSGSGKMIHIVDETAPFINAVIQQRRLKDNTAKRNLKIIYTPLHGTGLIPVMEALRQDGFTQITITDLQTTMDGTFHTVKSPNPEDPAALEMGISLAEKIDADIVLGTDPDCDRVGTAIKTENGYRLLTGNQIGALLIDFLLKLTDLAEYKRPVIINTIVTSELGAEIAKSRGVEVISTLTGFKYIGEKISQFENAKATGDDSKAFDYIFGYEESYGYLAGTHARDKDAVVASMLICEMAAYHKKHGKTLLNRMEELYEQFGYYHDTLDSYTLKGEEGTKKIQRIMNRLRRGDVILQDNDVQIIDYSEGIESETGFGKLPLADVLKYIMADGSWVAVRPSGTEPKIKIYYSIRGKNGEEAERKFRQIQEKFRKALEL